MSEENDMKRILAKECIENTFFKFMFSTAQEQLNERLLSLSPYEKDEFAICQAQRVLLNDLYGSFAIAAEDEQTQEEKSNIIL